MTAKLLKQLIIGMDKKDHSCEIFLVTLHSVGIILSSPMWTLALNSILEYVSSYIFVNYLVSLSLTTIFTFAEVSPLLSSVLDLLHSDLSLPWFLRKFYTCSVIKVKDMSKL